MATLFVIKPVRKYGVDMFGIYHNKRLVKTFFTREMAITAVNTLLNRVRRANDIAGL